MSPPRFTPEFKDEAVRQITERGYSVAEVSARLGVSAHSLYKWVSAVIAGATVYADGSLNFSGIANGDITVNRGGSLSVTGVVNASVRNNGGFVQIEGVIDRLISNGGNAIVSGQVGSFSGKGPVIFNKG
jgi:hypothetical protein